MCTPIPATLACAVLVALPLTAQQPVKAVTLTEALRLSAQYSPTVVSAGGAVHGSALSVRQAKLAYLPSLSIAPQTELDLSSGESRLDPVTKQVISGNTSNLSYGLGVTASYTLFDGFQRSHNIAAAEAGERAADAGLVTARFSNALTTTNAFLTALSDQQLVAVQQANVKLAERQFRVAAARVNGGSGSVTDSLTARVSLNTARVALLQAQTSLAADEAALGRLVGVSGRVAAIDDSSLYHATAPLDTAAILRDAVGSAPMVRGAQADLAQTHALYQAQKSLYWPSLNVAASTSWTSQQFNDYQVKDYRALSLYFSFNPWTNLQRETNVEQARIQMTDAEASLADARREVTAELEQQFALMAVAQSELELDSTSVAAARLDVTIRGSQYALGSGDIVALLQAQQNLNQAETSQITARYAYLRATAAIESILGRTLAGGVAAGR